MNTMNNNWNPFFALANTRDKIDEAFDTRKHQTMPQLDEDKLYEIQARIQDSYEESSIVEIKYFKNNKHVVETGIISKIDVYNRVIIINNISIEFTKIIDVNYL